MEESCCLLIRRASWNFIWMRNKLISYLRLFFEQLAYLRNTLFFVPRAALRTIESMRNNWNHVVCEPPPGDFGICTCLWASFFGVPAGAMGLLRTDFWFCHWNFPWSLTYCLVPDAAYFLPIEKWRMIFFFSWSDQSFCSSIKYLDHQGITTFCR